MVRALKTDTESKQRWASRIAKSVFLHVFVVKQNVYTDTLYHDVALIHTAGWHSSITHFQVNQSNIERDSFAENKTTILSKKRTKKKLEINSPKVNNGNNLQSSLYQYYFNDEKLDAIF